MKRGVHYSLMTPVRCGAFVALEISDLHDTAFNIIQDGRRTYPGVVWRAASSRGQKLLRRVQRVRIHSASQHRVNLASQIAQFSRLVAAFRMQGERLPAWRRRTDVFTLCNPPDVQKVRGRLCGRRRSGDADVCVVKVKYICTFTGK